MAAPRIVGRTLLTAPTLKKGQGLTRVKALLEQEREEINTLLSEEMDLQSYSAKSAANIRQFSQRLGDIEGELERVQKEKRKISAALEERKTELSNLQNSGRERQRSFYKSLKGLPKLAFLIGSESGDELRYQRYLQATLASQKQHIAEVSEKAGVLQRFHQDLSERSASEETLTTSLEQQLAKAKAAREDIEQRLEEVRVERRIHKQSTQKLQGKVLRYETARASLSLLNEKGARKAITRAPAAPVATSVPGGVLISSSGLPQRGLKFPFEGRLVSGTSTEGRKQFPAASKKKGVVFLSEKDSAAVAVWSGRVEFVGVLPGLGTTVVLDHGKKAFSLYSGLEEVGVKQGQLLTKGHQLGLHRVKSPFPAYFELRVQGRTQEVRRSIFSTE